VVTGKMIHWIYPNDFSHERFEIPERRKSPRVYKNIITKSLVASGLMIAGWAIGFPYALTAIVCATSLLLVAYVKPEKIFEEVDWTLLLFFAGLFVVLAGVQRSGLVDFIMGYSHQFFGGSLIHQIVGVSFVSLVLSNLVSNVPAVLIFRPLVDSMANPELMWLTLAMSSTFAGNFTLIGSVANLIVAEQAKDKVKISFGEYFKVGWILTIITILIGCVILWIEFV
jgi:Na+/H+ antiporter NhaD/arsenite permease-like protein